MREKCFIDMKDSKCSTLKLALLGGVALAALAICSCDSDKADVFVPTAALHNNVVKQHPMLKLEALKDPQKGEDISFDDIKPEYIKASCVSCHVNRKINLRPPALKTPDGKPSDAYYLGGRAGTVFNATSKAFEQPSPAIIEAGLSSQFLAGEAFFEGNFVADPHVPFGGLGPTYIKTSCISCHPGYGRGRRTDNFSQEYGNGYIAIVHHPDGRIVRGYTPMLQTKAVAPYVPYAKGVKIMWHEYVDKYSNRYADGTPYNAGKPTQGSLIYPTADIIDPQLPLPEDYIVSIESTIGIYGTGLLDAIADEDIIAEYDRQQSITGPVKGIHGAWIKEPNGQVRLGKFTWHCFRATLENGPGSNGIYNTTNVTRKDKKSLYITQEWVELQKYLGIDVREIEHPQKEELSKGDYDKFMIWHRGLAVPAARNLDRPEVQNGQKIFNRLGCASCHKAEWKTGDYPPMKAYSNQVIRPYTDLLMHDMGEENKGQFRTYRTPPLWGRGLMHKAANHTDMFHDLRARDFEEAILWHFGEAEFSRELFRNLSAKERKELILFLKSL